MACGLWLTRASVSHALDPVVCRIVAVAHVEGDQVGAVVRDTVQVHIGDVTGRDEHLQVLAGLQKIFE